MIAAAHCRRVVFEWVQLFRGSEPFDQIAVDRVYYPDGVNPLKDDLESGSLFADVGFHVSVHRTHSGDSGG